jgi:hypothetical protein
MAFLANDHMYAMGNATTVYAVAAIMMVKVV